MSADNYIAIWRDKKDGKFYGYDISASSSSKTLRGRPTWEPIFIADTIEEAIRKAQAEITEYGYHFVDI